MLNNPECMFRSLDTSSHLLHEAQHTVSNSTQRSLCSSLFNRLPRVQKLQEQLAQCLGFSVSGYPLSVARCLIEGYVNAVFGSVDQRRPTGKQVAFAAQFGADIRDETRLVADAVVDALMQVLNLEAIEKEQLAPGVTVRNIHDPFGQVFTISSIREDGIVFFKGGNGKKAWARNLRRV